MATPTIDTAVKPEKTLSRRKKRKRISAGKETLVPITCVLPWAKKTAASASSGERAEEQRQQRHGVPRRRR